MISNNKSFSSDVALRETYFKEKINKHLLKTIKQRINIFKNQSFLVS